MEPRKKMSSVTLAEKADTPVGLVEVAEPSPATLFIAPAFLE
jgi:hypothetical protein